jgi:hypothetical protein
MESLQERIEEARKRMYQLSKDKPLTSPEVVEASVKLDKLLNEYYWGLRK